MEKDYLKALKCEVSTSFFFAVPIKNNYGYFKYSSMGLSTYCVMMTFGGGGGGEVA